jgi:hypothetical protein
VLDIVARSARSCDLEFQRAGKGARHKRVFERSEPRKIGVTALETGDEGRVDIGRTLLA